jgi:thioredoxin-related protein
MKKILLILALLVSSVFAEVKYVDIFDAYDIAQKENKTVMVMLSQEGCPGCQYMENVVFNNTNISKILNEDFIVVYIDVYKEGAPDGLDFFATPTFYFLDADEKVLKRLNGGQNAKDFGETLEKVRK